MAKRMILGKEVQEYPRRTIADVDCWLSEDCNYIVAARKLEQPSRRYPNGTIRRWKAAE